MDSSEQRDIGLVILMNLGQLRAETVAAYVPGAESIAVVVSADGIALDAAGGSPEYKAPTGTPGRVVQL